MNGKNMKRGRNQRRRQGANPNRAFDSNGPDVRIRGTANQIYDKYQALARDATSSGDRVRAENYLQHAEHYFRVIRSMQPAVSAPSEQPDLDGEEASAPANGNGGRMNGRGPNGGGRRDEGADSGAAQNVETADAGVASAGEDLPNPEGAAAAADETEAAEDRPAPRPRRKRRTRTPKAEADAAEKATEAEDVAAPTS